jgi:cytoskeletal protein CcmA (bactofilin family)
MNQSDFRGLNFSFLGRNNFIKGEFKLTGDTIINSQLEGNLEMAGKGKLTLDRESSFTGNIFCHDLELFGELNGSIVASGSVIIRASAVLSGKIHAKSMKIYPGAIVNIEGETSSEEEQKSQKTLKS